MAPADECDTSMLRQIRQVRRKSIQLLWSRI